MKVERLQCGHNQHLHTARTQLKQRYDPIAMFDAVASWNAPISAAAAETGDTASSCHLAGRRWWRHAAQAGCRCTCRYGHHQRVRPGCICSKSRASKSKLFSPDEVLRLPWSTSASSWSSVAAGRRRAHRPAAVLGTAGDCELPPTCSGGGGCSRSLGAAETGSFMEWSE